MNGKIDINELLRAGREREQRDREERMARYTARNLELMLTELGDVELTAAERHSLEWLASTERHTCEQFAFIFRKARANRSI